MLAGGLRHTEQYYNAAGARSQATMLTLAVIALILPAVYRFGTGDLGAASLRAISIWLSLILLVVYAADLVFSLVTHRALFAGSHVETSEGEVAASQVAVSAVRHAGPMWQPALVLAAATAVIAWMSEILVGALEPAAEALGLNDAFMGVFVVAILGNAAEHSTAVVAAMKDRMDLSLSIAIGSSVQVALFVAPFLVLVSQFVGPAPMDLAFHGGLVLTILLAVWITGQVAGDGRSDWLRGVQLLAVYLILALVYLYVPGSKP
jgi:Ca2+:H+ antiporter